MPALAKPMAKATAAPLKERSNLGFRLMLVFSFLYYFRPEDIIPGLAPLHLAKVTGGLALLALLLGSKKGRPKKLPLELKLIFALYLWLILTIPFAYWRGGSFDVVFWEFSKAVIIALVLTLCASHTFQLRRLIFVQAFGVTLMTIASVVVNHRMQGRLAGIGDGLLSNPNDLAMNIALNWPLCLAFLLSGRGLTRRTFWGASMLIMVYAVMATYSRAGFMALSLAIVLCLWEFGVRGKRFLMLAGAVLCGLVLLVAVPQNYSKRLETLAGKFQQGDLDNGSSEARKELLLESLKITVTHPIFGVGPGNFQAYTRLWRVTHNTYTELSSECGIPALLLFLLLLSRAFRNVKDARRNLRASGNKELQLYAGALWVALWAYLLGAFFASTAYELFPYYLVAYMTVLQRIASQVEGDEVVAVKKPAKVPVRVYSPA